MRCIFRLSACIRALVLYFICVHIYFPFIIVFVVLKVRLNTYCFLAFTCGKIHCIFRYRQIVASGGQRAMDSLVDIVECIRTDIAQQGVWSYVKLKYVF